MMQKTYHTLLSIALICGTMLSTQAQDAEQIFTKATEHLVSQDMEMDMEMNTTDNKGRVKEKGFNVLIAKFGEVEKMKVSWEKPERAKGTTIIITTPPNEVGVIEVYTPSNGKIRKLKATEQNMKLVGSEFSMTNMSMGNPKELAFTYQKSEQYNNKSCHVIEVKSKETPDLSKGVLWIETESYQIAKIEVFDNKGNNISLVEMKEFKPVDGLSGKIHPMHIVSTDLTNNKTTDIKVLKISSRPNVSEEDFLLPAEEKL